MMIEIHKDDVVGFLAKQTPESLSKIICRADAKPKPAHLTRKAFVEGFKNRIWEKYIEIHASDVRAIDNFVLKSSPYDDAVQILTLSTRKSKQYLSAPFRNEYVNPMICVIIAAELEDLNVDTLLRRIFVQRKLMPSALSERAARQISDNDRLLSSCDSIIKEVEETLEKLAQERIAQSLLGGFVFANASKRKSTDAVEPVKRRKKKPGRDTFAFDPEPASQRSTGRAMRSTATPKKSPAAKKSPLQGAGSKRTEVSL